jgi:hypothetical protein
VIKLKHLHVRRKTPFEGFFYGWNPGKDFGNPILTLVHLLFFIFFDPSQLTFTASRKCLIYKEIPRVVGFNFSAKPLISLKKMI